MITRRQILQYGAFTAGAYLLPNHPFLRQAQAVAFLSNVGLLSDPALQPKFVELAPNALDPAFLFKDLNSDGHPSKLPNFSIRLTETEQQTGLVNPKNQKKLWTRVWGYGNKTVS
jgi:hypothetical protein